MKPIKLLRHFTHTQQKHTQNKENIMNQKQMFYSSDLSLAAENMRKMADLQSKAGMHDLARASLKDATARDYAKDYYDNDRKHDLKAALDYGEQRAEWGI